MEVIEPEPAPPEPAPTPGPAVDDPVPAPGPRSARVRPERPGATDDVMAGGSEAFAPLETDHERARRLTQEGTSALVGGQLPRAIQLFREATLAAPGHAPAWRGLGLANERMGRRPEAVRAYTQYLRMSPGARDAEAIQQRVTALGG